MSRIDTSMDAALRLTLLSEIRALLPAFLSAASIERAGVVNAAAELLGIPESALQQTLAVHMLLAQPVRDFTAALAMGLRQPISSSTRPRVTSQSVTSGIDWPGTIRRRATSSPMDPIWVIRPANRIFDIPENRALAWILKVLAERGEVAESAFRESRPAWSSEIQSTTRAARLAQRSAWLEGLPAEWPGDEVYARLAADRTGFYRLRVTEVARYLRPLLNEPSAEEIVTALCERYFEPTQDWKLFELAVLMRIDRELTKVGRRLREPQYFGGKSLFASFQIGSRRIVKLWYQGWPAGTKPSELQDAISHYELKAHGNRPDIVIETLDNKVSTQAIVLELKASGSASYLSDGFSQLLGYLRDRPKLMGRPASGWLVAPPTETFVSKPHGGRALWVTDSDAVASHVASFALDGA